MTGSSVTPRKAIQTAPKKSLKILKRLVRHKETTEPPVNSCEPKIYGQT